MKRDQLKMFLFSALCAFSLQSMAQSEPIVYKVWPNGAPNTNGATAERPASGGQKFDFEPILTVFPAAEPNGLAVICCPGGGYSMLSNTHEGRQFSTWYNEQGITFALIDYRMPGGHKDVPLSDVQEAMRIMNAHASEWKYTKLGIMGSSAGGHLASTAATHYTDAVTKPAFQILFYPVITMEKGVTHQSSRDFLIGKTPSEEDIKLFSNELQVTPETPPAFIVHCTDDFVVPVENSIRYYTALVKNKVKVTMHIYPNGGHGWGVQDRFKYKQQWSNELQKWLEAEILPMK